MSPSYPFAVANETEEKKHGRWVEGVLLFLSLPAANFSSVYDIAAAAAVSGSIIVRVVAMLASAFRPGNHFFSFFYTIVGNTMEYDLQF